MNRSVIHSILIVFVLLLAYSNTLHVPFIFDDQLNIVNNERIKDLQNFSNSSILSDRRYLGNLTFALNYRIHGLQVMGYHIVNILIHIVNALLVYALAFLTLKTPWLRDRFGTSNLKRYLPLGAGLLFAVHPLQTQAVTYIVQRFASLATLFYLGSLVLYIRARLAQTRGPSIAWYVGSVLCAVCAMKTKEIAFTLPVMIVLYELFFFKGKPARRFMVLVPLMLAMLIIPLSILGVDRPLGEIIEDVSDVTRVQSPLSRWEYLATQGRVIMTYLRLLVLPVNQNLDYDYPIYHSLFDPAVLASFGVLMLLAGAGICLYMRSRRGEPLQRLIAYGVFWFFITLSVESSVIPITDVIYEHRMYLPSVGVFLAIGAGGVSIAQGMRERQREVMKVITAGFAMIVLLLTIATFVRNRTWGDEIILCEDVVRKSPQKVRPHYNLGVVYHKTGRKSEAIEEYKKALKLKPDYAEAHNNLGNVYMKSGRTNEAIEEYESALKLKPDYAEAHNNLGLVSRRMGRTNNAMEAFQTALRLRPDYVEAHNNLGTVYFELGRTSDALEEYKTALRLRPNFVEALNNLGIIYFKTGRMYDALKEYQNALTFRPDDADTHNNVGNVYLQLGQFEKARNEYLTTLRIKPDDLKAHYNLGVVYHKTGRTNDAIQEYKTALRLRPDYAEAHNSLGIVYFKTGRMYDALKEFQTVLRFKPDDAETHNNIGNVYLQLGQFEKARNEYLTALRSRPDFVEAHNNLGIVYFKTGRMYDALKEFQTVLRVRPDDADTHYNLGNVYFELRQIEKARNEYLTALRLNPNLTRARDNLKFVSDYLKTNQNQE